MKIFSSLNIVQTMSTNDFLSASYHATATLPQSPATSFLTAAKVKSAKKKK
jgi:hypothetical protein